MSGVRIVAAGDAMLVAEFEDRIAPEVNAKATMLAARVLAAGVPGVRDVVPTFRSVAVYFDPVSTDAERLAVVLREVTPSSGVMPTRAGKSVEVPVCYDEEFGLDLEEVGRAAGLSRDEVVAIHAGRAYRVYMLGFLPGFAYLAAVDPRIAAPRRRSPRLRVAAGSVAIAGEQTGIYPCQSPGGWNIVGRTPTAMLSIDRAEPALLAAGDTVCFRPISRGEFDRLAGPPV